MGGDILGEQVYFLDADHWRDVPHCFRPNTPLSNSIPSWLWPLTAQQQWFRNGLRNTTSSRCCLGLQIPQIAIQLSICRICWTIESDSWRPRNSQDLKDLLLTCWSPIPQHTFRALVESMLRCVRAALPAKGRYNVMAYRCVLCLKEHLGFIWASEIL